jgi:hypothetical protein
MPLVSKSPVFRTTLSARPRAIIIRQVAVPLLVVAVLFTNTLFGAPVVFTEQFPSGFAVSINGGPLSPSGPITVKGLVDTTTLDINSGTSFGEFPLISATFSGSGFLNRSVTTPLSLLTFNSFGPQMFAFQLTGQFNQGIIGWNGSTASGNFMANINDLSTLFTLPYTTTGSSTFWFDSLAPKAWTLALGGDTIGANIGGGGPNGTFTISAVPEPSSLALSTFALISLAVWGRQWRRRTL